MESMTTTSATQISGVGHVCPQAKPRLAVTRVWTRGTTVSTRVSADFVPAARDGFVPALGDGFGAPIAPKSIDVVYLRTGRPPV